MRYGIAGGDVSDGTGDQRTPPLQGCWAKEAVVAATARVVAVTSPQHVAAQANQPTQACRHSEGEKRSPASSGRPGKSPPLPSRSKLRASRKDGPTPLHAGWRSRGAERRPARCSTARAEPRHRALVAGRSVTRGIVSTGLKAHTGKPFVSGGKAGEVPVPALAHRPWVVAR